MSRKNQELAFARRESTVDGTAALGFSKWRWKPPKILSPILKAMWQCRSKSISGFFESNHRPMSSKKPENIRIIPGGVKNFAHSTIGFSRQSREEINFNCWKSTKAISTKDDRVQIQTDPPNPTWSGSLQP